MIKSGYKISNLTILAFQDECIEFFGVIHVMPLINMFQSFQHSAVTTFEIFVVLLSN